MPEPRRRWPIPLANDSRARPSRPSPWPEDCPMSQPHASVVRRTVRGVARRCRVLRNTIEWGTVHALRHEAPWSTNRWGQRYQAVSLAESHYLRDCNPVSYASALLERVLRPGMTVVDVGANHGMFSLEAAHLVGEGGTVHAF